LFFLYINKLSIYDKLSILLNAFSKGLNKHFTLENYIKFGILFIFGLIVVKFINSDILTFVNLYYKIEMVFNILTNLYTICTEPDKKKLEDIFTNLFLSLFNAIFSNLLIRSIKHTTSLLCGLISLIKTSIIWITGGENSGSGGFGGGGSAGGGPSGNPGGPGSGGQPGHLPTPNEPENDNNNKKKHYDSAKNIWKFQLPKKKLPNQTRPVILEDTMTGQKYECQSARNAAEKIRTWNPHMNATTAGVLNAGKKGLIFRKRYKVEFKNKSGK
jgi:hypothetical protein